MSVWDKITKIAKEVLGESAIPPKNLSDIQDQVVPEQGVLSNKKYTSFNTDISDIDVLPEYEFIYQAIEAGCPSLFVTGKAGTGKSTLIRWLTHKIDACAVVAPTAIAAMNVGGVTIHSLFGLPATHIDPDEDFNPSEKTRTVIENLKCLVIDEVSMVVPNLVDVMDKILRQVKRNDNPFGGVPTIFIGDLLQLPPVVSSQEESIYFSHRYKTPYFFSADTFKTQKLLPVNLKVVRRQTDETFIQALSHIRTNSEHRDHVALFNRQCYRDKDRGASETGVYLVPTNRQANEINTAKLNSLDEKLVVFEARTTGTVPAGRWKLNAPSRLELKVGAKVIFVKNKMPQWVNGDLGGVVGIDTDSIRVKKDKTDNVLLVGRETWNKYSYTYNYQTQKIEKTIIGTFEQFPVALGWAITIHKSQGMTLDHVTIDLGQGAFCEGQTYVALSRARTIDGITLARPISMKDVKVDPTIIEFYEHLGIE